MTFNENSKIRTDTVSKRGRNTAIAVGGGGLLALALALIGPAIGIDLSGFNELFGGSTSSTGSTSDETLEQCQTGEDANNDAECRVVGAAASLDAYWSTTLPTFNAEYRSPHINLFDGSTQSSCGTASAATGPFYCPGDEDVYIDTAFFDDLRQRYGATGGPLAQLYIVGHEWGHHIQNITNIMAGLNLSQSGPSSDSVRLELQADCFAGAWIGDASTTLDANGNTFLKTPTRDEINDALDAAAVVGDDNIQKQSAGHVSPDGFTHGTSKQRQSWFLKGFNGNPGVCNTFDVSASEL